MSTKLTPLQLAILQAMQAAIPPQQNALAELFGSRKGETNALADLFKPSSPKSTGLGMFANSYPSALGSGLLRPGGRSLFGSGIAPKTRHVFYSFHYADVFRVNHIRKSDQFRSTDKESPRVVDRSLWERARNTNPTSLAGIIDRGLEGTSTTCVLAGFATWSREWVRYEIARSLARGNGLLTVYLNGCQCPNTGFDSRGPNPLDQLALGADMRIYEWQRGAWQLFRRVSEELPVWPKWLRQLRFGEPMVQLSQGAASYDWIADDGLHNLIRWTDAAASAAGK